MCGHLMDNRYLTAYSGRGLLVSICGIEPTLYIPGSMSTNSYLVDFDFGVVFDVAMVYTGIVTVSSNSMILFITASTVKM